MSTSGGRTLLYAAVLNSEHLRRADTPRRSIFLARTGQHTPAGSNRGYITSDSSRDNDLIELTAHSLTAVLFLVGLLTALLPVIPGSLIVWLGVLGTNCGWAMPPSAGAQWHSPVCSR